MKRELPTITIEGTVFEVNVEQLALTERDNPANQISFIGNMQDNESHYIMLYDKSEKSFKKDVFHPDHIVPVRIPLLIELDPVGMAEKYDYPVSLMKDKTDFDIMVDQKLLEDRLSGKLPQIEIAGQIYTVDLRRQELQPVDETLPVLNLRHFDNSEEEGNHQAYYDLQSRMLIGIGPDIIKVPESMVLISIPNILKLDPVGIAMQFGTDERELLKRYPIENDLKAVVISIPETPIPELIARNKLMFGIPEPENRAVQNRGIRF